MQVVVSKKELTEAIALVASTVSLRSTAPILTNLLLTAQNDRLLITGTDLETWMQVEIPATVKEAGGITLPSKRFSDIVRELADADISISTDGARAHIICGRADFNLLGMDDTDYPELPTFAVEQNLTLPRLTLLYLIEKTLFAVSDEEKRYALNGICTQVEEDELRMIATDGYRLSFARNKLAVKADKAIDLIIPAKAARELQKVLAGEGDVELQLGSMHISFSTGNCLLVSRLLDGRFPPYKDVIPTNYEKRAVVNRKTFTEVVRRMSLICDEKMRQLVIGFSAGTLKIRGQNAGLGEAVEEMDITWEGDAMDVAYNADYLLSILKVLDGEELVMEMTTNLKPALMRSSENEDHLCILTPMRL